MAKAKRTTKRGEPAFLVKPEGKLTDEDIDALADELVAAIPDSAFKQAKGKG
jgi:hypothetical protein